MPEPKLTQEEKKQLLDIARNAISQQLGKSDPSQTADNSSLQRQGGAFVTLHKSGRLRGCIGTFRGTQPLVKTVQEMAVSAAQKDPRFSALMPDELEDIDLEISVLSPLERIDNVESIQVGRHGIYITRGPFSGVLLPQVATEYGWDRLAFLAHTCQKAGLPNDAWQDPETKIEVFEAQVFGEKDLQP